MPSIVECPFFSEEAERDFDGVRLRVTAGVHRKEQLSIPPGVLGSGFHPIPGIGGGWLPLSARI